MLCESWRTKLSEAAASGETLPREAGAHLAECTACRAAFAHEEQLSALIDGGLRSVANAPVPTSLLPRVRGAIAQPPAPATWRVPFWAFAGAGLLLLVGIAYEWTRAPHPTPLPQPIAAVVPPAAASLKASSQPSTPFVATPARRAASLRIASVRTAPARCEPEILVSGEEQANLQLYLNRLRARNVNNAAPLNINGDAQIKPLEIASMEFPQLSIKPLESDDSR